MKNQFITETLKQLFKLMGVAVQEVISDEETKTGGTRFAVLTQEAQLLIGEGGARLLALNLLMKRIAEKKFGDDAPSFMIDINDFQKKRMDDIRAKAHMLAERARYFKSAVEMDPMSSYERMIVHSEFSDAKDIITESTGAGRDRRIILKYKDPEIV